MNHQTLSDILQQKRQSRPKKEVHNGSNVFRYYVDLLKKQHPEAWLRLTHTAPDGRRHRSLRMYDTDANGVPQVLADHQRFQVISEVMFWIAGEYLINGWEVLLCGLGGLRPIYQPTSGLHINWKATIEYCKANGFPVKREHFIFYTNEMFASIDWRRNRTIPKISNYKFYSAAYCRNGTGLRERFSRALRENPDLIQNYLHITK